MRTHAQTYHITLSASSSTPAFLPNLKLREHVSVGNQAERYCRFDPFSRELPH